MKLLGVDFETTGLLFDQHRIVEIGAVLWDHELRAPVEMLNKLVVPADWGPHGMDPQAEKTHGLSQQMLRVYGMDTREALSLLASIAQRADYVVAHNGLNFDKPFWKAECVRNQLHPAGETPMWIDTAQDVPYPENISSRRLIHLAAEHGFLNPFAHRAVFDVMTMLQVLSKYDIHAVLSNAKAPTVKVRALASYDQRELPKARRYSWDPVGKIWWKNLKEFDLEKEKKEAPFQIVILETVARTGAPDGLAAAQPAVAEPASTA